MKIQKVLIFFNEKDYINYLLLEGILKFQYVIVVIFLSLFLALYFLISDEK